MVLVFSPAAFQILPYTDVSGNCPQRHMTNTSYVLLVEAAPCLSQNESFPENIFFEAQAVSRYSHVWDYRIPFHNVTLISAKQSYFKM